MLDPHGPLPREIYLRRRVAALVLVAIVVIGIVVGLWFASRDGSGEAASSGSESPSPTAPAASTSTASSSATTSATDAASRGRCDDASLAVTVKPSAADFPAGSKVLLYAEITNTGKTPCDRDLAGAPLTFEVYKLDDNSRVWSSTDCTKVDGEDKANLAPGKPVMRQIEWTGRVSQPGACDQRDRLPAEPGAYQVYALVGNVFSPAATFNLTKPAA